MGSGRTDDRKSQSQFLEGTFPLSAYTDWWLLWCSSGKELHLTGMTYTTCRVTYGSGVPTGMTAVIMRGNKAIIPRAPPPDTILMIRDWPNILYVVALLCVQQLSRGFLPGQVCCYHDDPAAGRQHSCFIVPVYPVPA